MKSIIFKVLVFAVLVLFLGCGGDSPSVAPVQSGGADSETVYEKCSECGKPIDANESYWCVTVQNEVFDGQAVTVNDAWSVFVYCEKCAAKKNFEGIVVPSK